MTCQTYAEWYEANPLPVCGTIFADLPVRDVPAPVTAGRIVRLDDALDTKERVIAKNETKRKEVVERYSTALSKDKWTSAKDMAAILGVSPAAVMKVMKTEKMKAITRRASRFKGNTTYFVWRLK